MTEIQNLQTFQNRVTDLEAEIQGLRSQLQNGNVEPTAPKDQCALESEIYQEFLDRESRKKNLIVFGIPETSGENAAQIDKDAVLSVFSTIAPDIKGNLESSRSFRLGAPSENKIRPIKIVFNSSEMAENIAKNSKKLSDHPNLKHISIRQDKTPKQLEEYRRIRQQLHERLEAGESGLRIKFIRGVPKIVNNHNNLN